MSRITDKDKLIYKHIEKVGFATVKQIGNIFYNNIIYRNEQAKKRLNCLIEHGYIKKKKSKNCTQDIFYADKKYSNQTYHNIVVLDFYSKLIEMKSAKILHFEREKCWNNNKAITDGFFTIQYTNSRRETVIQSIILEVQCSTNDWRKNILKYYDKEVFSEINNYCNDPGTPDNERVFPTIVLADDIYHNMSDFINIPPYKVIQIDAKLTDFPLIFEN